MDPQAAGGARSLKARARRADRTAVRFARDQIRHSLACVGLGSISVAYYGIHLVTPAASPFPLTASEFVGMSLPLTVAWFSLSGSCMLASQGSGLAGLIASGSRFAGRAAFLAGIPVWAYWYLHLAFRII